MRVLVTGVGGFLGGALARHWSTSSHDVLGLTTRPVVSTSFIQETSDYSLGALCQTLRNFAPDILVHAAGRASVPISIADPKSDFDAGPALVANVLEALRRESAQTKLLFLSSAAIYGQPEILPVPESAPSRPLSPYGYHKRIAELLCTEYRALYGLPCATVRIFSAYGPGLRRQVFWDLCRKFSSHAKNVRLQGTGEESRDFVNVRDIARAIDLVISKGNFDDGCYNLASGVETTIREVAAKVSATLGSSYCVPFDGRIPKGNPARWQADLRRLSALGFVPEIALDEGIREYAEWFRRMAAPINV